MKLEHSVRQDQRLIMSAAMERAFQILMMPTLELSEWLESEVEKNPLLKLTKASLELPETQAIHREATLYEHLLHEIELAFDSSQEKEIARFFAGSLDEKGFLSLSEKDYKGKEGVLEKFQQLTPLGIGARNAREALLIQLQDKKGSLAYQLILEHYQDLLYHRLGKISKGLSINLSQVQDIIQKEIRCLYPFPGHSFLYEVNPYLTADISLQKEDEQWIIEVCDSELPRIEIHEAYLEILQNPNLKKDESDFIRRHLAAGNWLKRSIDRRRKTLHHIASYLLKTQRNFLEGVAPSPKPMTMKEVAVFLNLNESTITRAISNKAVASPRGLIPLRQFFSHAVQSDRGEISNQEAKDLLIQLIDQESEPLSDEALSKKLKTHGIQCARRTVTKYRKELKIGSASQRKIYKFIR